MVNVDIAALRSIEREKEIPFNTLMDALETALLTAYKHTPHSMPHARVAIDRKTGEVIVWAQELGPDGDIVEEYDDTPTDFGRVAAMTARQVILQRLRDAEHDQTFGEYSGREGDIVTGVIQADAQAAQRGVVLVDIGKIEAVLPQSEQVPGEDYTHGTRLRCYVIGVTRGMRGPQVTVSRTHPNLVKKLFALEVPEIADGSVEIVDVAREAGHRTQDRGAHVGRRAQRQGRVHRPDGPAGAQRRRRTARREDRHRRLGRGPGHLRRQRAVAGARAREPGRRPGRPRPVRVVVPDFQLSLAIGREGQNARLAARLTGWRIDIHSDAEAAGPAAAPAAAGRPAPAAPALGRHARARGVDCSWPSDRRRHPIPFRPGGPRNRAQPDPDVHRVPAAGGGRRVAPRRRWAGIDRRFPTRVIAHPAEVLGCTPTPDAWTSPSGAGRSAGPSGCPDRSTRRRSASTSTAATRARTRPAEPRRSE